MTVGVAVESQTLPQPTCALATSEGRQIPMSVAGGEATLYRQSDNRMRVVGLAKLKPGSYVATCDYGGSDSRNISTFTVGHALDASNLSEFAPVFWFIGIAVISGLMFVAGVITLTVGVFRKNRARKQGFGGYPGGPRPGGPYSAGPYPPGAGGPYPGGPYPPAGPSGPPQGPGPSGYPPPPSGYPPGPPSEPGVGPGQPYPGAPQPGPNQPGSVRPGSAHPDGEPEYPWRVPSEEPGPGDQSGPSASPPSGWTVPPSKK